MSNSKKVECVICDYGGRHMLIPCDDETKTELNSLWTIYHKLIKVEAREPSACHVNDFSHRDSPVFYSFCNFCLPHVSRLCDLYNQLDKQIELIWAIPSFTEPSSGSLNSNGNVSELNQNDVDQSTSGTRGNKRKRRKLTHVSVPVQNNSSINSSDPGPSDSSLASNNTVCEDDEIVILEKKLCTQNQNVQMVSIDSDEEEENNTEIMIKQLDDSDYVFVHKSTCINFMRSDCLLKFDCSLCSTKAQNITGIINHLWRMHCEDGNVKSLPNYRIDVSNANSSTTQSSAEKENMNIDEDSSSEPEIIDDNSSAGVVSLSRNSVCFKADLIFNQTRDGMWRCSFCRLSVNKDEIVSHTNICLPRKRNSLRKRNSATRKNMPPKSSLPISDILYRNGWPYCKISKRRYICAAEGCEFEHKNRAQIFSHIRRLHAGIKGGTVVCRRCDCLPFGSAKALWIHIYEEHNRTHL